MEHDRAAAIAALRRGLDAGMTHIDTAEMYGAGAVEEIVGEAIAGRRDEVFLVVEGAARERLAARHDRRLRAQPARLRTDRLDSTSCTGPGDHPLEETVAGVRGPASRRGRSAPGA